MFIISRKEDRLKSAQSKTKYLIMVFTFIITFILFVFTVTEKLISPLFSTVEITQNKTEFRLNRESLDSEFYNLATSVQPENNNNSYFFLSNITTLQNNTSKNLVISEGLIDIIDVKPIKRAEPEISYGIEKNKLIIFIINNGLGNLEESKFQLSIVLEDIDGVENKLTDDDIKNLFLTNPNMTIPLHSGEIKRFFELSFSKELHELFENNEKYLAIKINIIKESSEKKFEIHHVYYNHSEKEFVFGGMGAAGSVKTAVLLLDPDDPPQSYSVAINKKINAKSSEQVNLLLVPTKSSKITYSIIYSMDNSKKTRATEKIETNITVPLYDLGISPNSSFFQSLVKNHIVKYQYNTNYKFQKDIGYDYKKVLNPQE